MRKVTLAVFLLSISLSAPIAAGPLEEGRAAAERGDYATALQLLRPLAEQGDANAQYNLGYMYDYGKGVPKDFVEAVKWFRLAAEQGHAIAQYDLGSKYSISAGVPQDNAEMAKWFRLAAEQGHALAQVSLGSMYDFGAGVPKDYVQSHMWFSLAAAQGLPVAELRDRVAAKMSSAQIAEAEKLAREWKPK